jgi:hypothetical protein
MVPIDLAYSGIGFTPAIFTSTERAKCLMARPNRYSLEEPWIGGPLRNRRGSLKCLKSGTRWRIAIRILRPTLTLHSESFSGSLSFAICPVTVRREDAIIHRLLRTALALTALEFLSCCLVRRKSLCAT